MRTWLYRIATNACLDADRAAPDAGAADRLRAARRPARRPGRAARGVRLDRALPGRASASRTARHPDPLRARESVELAFVAALQHLPATQRAVLILREVLGFSAREVADSLDTSVAVGQQRRCSGRARRSTSDCRPRASRRPLRALGDQRWRSSSTATCDAWERGDVDAVVAMLAEDAAVTMPPMATWFRGRGVPGVPGRLGPCQATGRRLRAHANGQAAFGSLRVGRGARALRGATCSRSSPSGGTASRRSPRSWSPRWSRVSGFPERCDELGAGPQSVLV